MKTMSRTILAAVASVIAIVSCGKVTPTGGDTPGGDTPGGNTEPEVTERIIAVSFDTKATRTTFDGTAYDEPHFVASDLIRVWKSDGSGYEDFAVYERNSEYYIKVGAEFTGDLKAVYPSKYATTDSDNPFYVPSVQTGRYADANICTATIEESATSVVFYDQTAVIGVKVPGNTSHLEVTSLGLIGTDGYRGTTCIPIIDESGKDPYTITVDGDPETVIVDEEYMYFVSILTDDTSYSNVKLVDLNFDITYGPEGHELYSMGGFPPVKVWRLMHRSATSGDLIDAYDVYAEQRSMYILPNNYLHDYILVDGVKWATMNVGAASLTDPGYYFKWAGVDSHKYVVDKWNFADSYTFDDYAGQPNPGFYATDGEYFLEGEYTKYSSSEESLCLWDDAAFANWGGSWSMPTTSDFIALAPAPDVITTSDNGFWVQNNTVFFPVSSWVGQDESPLAPDFELNLWTSNVYEDEEQDGIVGVASVFYISTSPLLSVSIDGCDRSYGVPVRPIGNHVTGGDDPKIDMNGTLGPIGKSDL